MTDRIRDPAPGVTRRRLLRTGIATGTLLLGAGALSGGAAAEPASRCTLNWGRELNAGRCDGDLVVDVTQEVRNDIDAGHDGYWALVDYRRHIAAWQTAPETHCAVVTYHGQFDAVAGQTSPGRDTSEPLTGEERGTIEGGYVAAIEGVKDPDPGWSTRGFVGTFDYEGDVQTGERPGAVDWTEVYFPGRTFGFDWWGWIYQGGQYGTWVNASDKDCGDISG